MSMSGYVLGNLYDQNFHFDCVLVAQPDCHVVLNVLLLVLLIANKYYCIANYFIHLTSKKITEACKQYWTLSFNDALS